MAYKLLVTDLDGTVAYRDQIPEIVQRACRELKGQGWEIMVATGRILGTAIRHIESLEAQFPAIVYDGARVMEPRTGEVLFERFLEPATAEEVLEEGWDDGLSLQVFGDESVILRPDDSLSLAYFRGTSIPVRRSLESPQVDAPVYRVIFFGDPVKVRKLARRLEDRLGPRGTVTLAGEGFLDVLAPCVSKGTALKYYLASLSCRPELVVCAGDHLNDSDLLQVGDVAAVPRNAPASLLERAHMTFPPAEEGGFAALVEKLLQGVPVSHWR